MYGQQMLKGIMMETETEMAIEMEMEATPVSASTSANAMLTLRKRLWMAWIILLRKTT